MVLPPFLFLLLLTRVSGTLYRRMCTEHRHVISTRVSCIATAWASPLPSSCTPPLSSASPIFVRSRNSSSQSRFRVSFLAAPCAFIGSLSPSRSLAHYFHLVHRLTLSITLIASPFSSGSPAHPVHLLCTFCAITQSYKPFLLLYGRPSLFVAINTGNPHGD